MNLLYKIFVWSYKSKTHFRNECLERNSILSHGLLKNNILRRSTWLRLDKIEERRILYFSWNIDLLSYNFFYKFLGSVLLALFNAFNLSRVWFYKSSCPWSTMWPAKVRTFWEAHKNLRNLPHALYIYLVNVKTMRKIFFKFCVLLRKSELYSVKLYTTP